MMQSVTKEMNQSEDEEHAEVAAGQLIEKVVRQNALTALLGSASSCSSQSSSNGYSASDSTSDSKSSDGDSDGNLQNAIKADLNALGMQGINNVDKIGQKLATTAAYA